MLVTWRGKAFLRVLLMANYLPSCDEHHVHNAALSKKYET